MQDQVNATPTPLKRVPWNKGSKSFPARPRSAAISNGS
jgi:hypothetical protein